MGPVHRLLTGGMGLPPPPARRADRAAGTPIALVGAGRDVGLGKGVDNSVFASRADGCYSSLCSRSPVCCLRFAVVRYLEIVSTGLITRLAAVMAMVGRLVPDGLWELFQRVVPAAPVRPQGGGRRRYGDREVLAAILFVATTGCTWRQLPPVFGPSGPTAHQRFTEWSRARVWGKLHRLVLDELGSRGELDWSRCAIDSVNMRATKGGTGRVRIPWIAARRDQRST